MKLQKTKVRHTFIFLMLVITVFTLNNKCKDDLLGSKKTWLFDHTQIKMDDIDLIIRTANLKSSWDHFPQRMKGIAETFYIDWPYNNQIGLIGVQEAGKKQCCGDTEIQGTKCLTGFIEEAFDKEADFFQENNIGIIVDGDWIIESHKYKKLGQDSWNMAQGPLLERSERGVIEVVVSHKSKPWKLRFYNLHLSHKEEQEDQRLEQIENLINWISGRVQEGELPPIVVGDFNFKYSLENNCYKKMCMGGFRLLWPGNGRSPDIDQIWWGKKESFPQTKGSYILLRSHSTNGKGGVDLVANHSLLSLPYSCNGEIFEGGPFSDHSQSPAVSLKILDDEDEWIFQMSPPPVCN